LCEFAQPSFAAAVEWYEKAVELGEPGALNGLGYLNFFGKEVPQNLTRSLELFLRNGRDGDSLFNAGYQYLHAMGTPRNAQVCEHED
jgi:TPR repeat protein